MLTFALALAALAIGGAIGFAGGLIYADRESRLDHFDGAGHSFGNRDFLG